ncbi:MAG: P27 family phage terminase small subunit [Solirubrobacteraceae bacterium]
MVPNALAHLSELSVAWLRELEAAYDLAPHERKLALSAAEALDRSREARERLEKDGVLLADRFGQLKPHPAVAIERDSRAQFTRIISALRLPTFTKPDYTTAGGF